MNITAIITSSNKSNNSRAAGLEHWSWISNHARDCWFRLSVPVNNRLYFDKSIPSTFDKPKS